MKFITLRHVHDIPSIITEFRKTFATVFSHHYAKQITQAKKKNVTEKLKGFSDLLAKEKYFTPGVEHDQKQIQQQLEKLYFGPGFDDEAAFLLAFHDLKKDADAKEHYAKIKERLKPEDRTEVEDYFRVLDAANRRLKEVDFAAFIDDEGKIHGFVLYHVFEENGKTILHARQAAMLRQNTGYASVVARYFADKYPDAFYEANQRQANSVPMKEKLIATGEIKEKGAVLGYPVKFYKGLEATAFLQKLFVDHYKDKDLGLLGCKKHGAHWEAESVPARFFQPQKLVQDLMPREEGSKPRHYLSQVEAKEFKSFKIR